MSISMPPAPNVLASIHKARYWFLFAGLLTVTLIYCRNSDSLPDLFEWLPVLGRTLPYTLGGLVTLLAYRYYGGSFASVGLQLPDQSSTVKALLWIAGFGLAVLAARIAMPLIFEPLLDFAGPQTTRQSTREALGGNLPLLLALLPLMWIVVFFEEWLLRGLVLNAIAEYLGPKVASWIAAVVISSLIFGLLHWGKGSRAVVSSTLGGLVYGTAYVLLKRNLWPSVVGHCLANTLGFISLFSDD